MRTLNSLVVVASLCAAWPLGIRAQSTFLDLPRESQHGMVMQRIGTTDITVDYHRPSVNGRTIWGDVVAYDQVWRAGANENTTFTTSTDITVEGKTLTAGTYGLHMIPTKSTWTIIFNKESKAWGSFFYDEKKDALRVNVTSKPGNMTEQITYDFVGVSPNSATLILRWEKLEVPIAITVDVQNIVVAGIDDQLRGLNSYNWQSWVEAAQYCRKAKQPEKAMAMIDRSIAMQPTFTNQRIKMGLLRDAGKEAEAAALEKQILPIASNTELNEYAYGLMNMGKKAEAVKMFEMNAKRHADDPNTHDSLGEGYMSNGQNDLAIKSFKKSLSMNPPEGVKANSIKCLKKLGVDTSQWETEKAKS